MRINNPEAWAIGKLSTRDRFHIRRVVWGRMLAREERRDGETIRPVIITAREPKPHRRSQNPDGELMR